MLTDLVKKTLLALCVLAGVFAFIFIAPFMIIAAWLLMWGFISLVIVALIVYGIYELWKER